MLLTLCMSQQEFLDAVHGCCLRKHKSRKLSRYLSDLYGVALFLIALPCDHLTKSQCGSNWWQLQTVPLTAIHVDKVTKLIKN